MFTTAIPFPALDLLRQGLQPDAIATDYRTSRAVLDNCHQLVTLGFMQAMTTTGGQTGFRTTAAGRAQVELLDGGADPVEFTENKIAEHIGEANRLVSEGNAAQILGALTANGPVEGGTETTEEPIVTESTETTEEPVTTESTETTEEATAEAPVAELPNVTAAEGTDGTAPAPEAVAPEALTNEASDAPEAAAKPKARKGQKDEAADAAA